MEETTSEFGLQTYLSQNHDLIARKVMLFDCLSENNFGMPIRIDLNIAHKR